MKQNTPAIYLQISTAQGPAECRIFARFVLDKLLAEAQAKGLMPNLLPKPPISTAFCRQRSSWKGRKPKVWRKLGRGRSNGYAPVLSARNIRAKIGI